VPYDRSDEDLSRLPCVARAPLKNDRNIIVRFDVKCFFLIFQIQNDKDKILYELDELQSQLEKAQVSWAVL